MGNSQRILRSRRRRRFRFVAVVLPLLHGCTARQAPAPAVAESAPEFELVSGDPAVAAHEAAPAVEGDLLLADEFERFDSRWSNLAEGGTAGPPSGVELVAEGAGARGIALLSPGTRGLGARIEVTRTDALLLTARVRSFAAGQQALLRASNVEKTQRLLHPLIRPIAASDSFTEWSLVLGACRDRKAVQIDLVAGDRPLAVDRIELRCLPPVEGLWLAPRDEGAPLLPHGRHRVELQAMDTEMEGFYLPTGGTLRARTRVPRSSPRLDLETALLAGDRGGSAEWTVAVDGAPIARRRERVGPAEWESPYSPWIVPLDAFAGREVELEVRCAGDRTALGFAGKPRLLGAAPPHAPPGVILISLDTLRRDRVGRDTGGGSLTPRIDRLAARGCLFTDAASTSSWTLPAHASLMTGQHPLVHRAVDGSRPIDGRCSSLLAERFRRQGYATAAFTAGGFVDPRFGFGSGFDLYSVRDPCGVPHDAWQPHASVEPSVVSDAELDATPKRAFDWVRRHADAPFFLFLHTYHVHEYDDEAHDGAGSQRLALLDRASSGDAAAVAELVRRYDACVAESDRDLVGGVVDLLDQLHLAERTVVAVVSDHGEEFLEHGGFRHGRTLRNEVASIALLLAGPGVPRGVTIDRPVSITGVAPTLARLAGLPPDPRCFGRDLLESDDRDPRAILLDLHTDINHHRVRGEALWLGEWQMQRMWDEHGEATVSFERRDPATGLVRAAEPSPSERRLLELRLDAEMAARLREAPPASDAGEQELPEALRERLQALGYAGH